MFNIGVPELILILVIVLVFFKAGKLSELGSSLGEGIRNFRKAYKDTKETNLLENGNKTSLEITNKKTDNED